MNKGFWLLFFLIMINAIAGSSAKAQTSPSVLPATGMPDLWTNDQLIEPADLISIIKSASPVTPLIFNTGAVEDIKGAKHIGPVSNAENMEKFKLELASLPLDKLVIIYCGCCPFAKCPNIRPAFLQLKKMGFTKIKVLNLPVNLKTNWISKGYPLGVN